jgi:hypothetical protein
MISPKVLRFAIVAAAVSCMSKSGAVASGDSAQTRDSAFAKLQQHGAMVMGVDQYTSKHRFEPLPDGGRIVLQREANDTAGEATIRKHMRQIAAEFAGGDFSSPEMVHSMPNVPGTAVMNRLKNEITYTAGDVARGGEVRIVSRNPDAIAAIHEFLAFQRQDHRAGM